MTIRFSNLVPAVLRHAKQAYIERVRLSRVERVHCDASMLRSISDTCPDEILRSEGGLTGWLKVQPLLQRFPIPDGAGGVNPGDRRAIFVLVHGLRAASVIEVGTHIGASTLHIAAALSEISGTTSIDPRLVSVDIYDVNHPLTKPWLKRGARHSPAEVMHASGFDSFVHFVVSDSLEFLRHSQEKADVIFLDGNHSGVAVYREVPAALKMLNPGGVILLHDYFPGLRPLWSNGSVIPGPYLAIERLRREGANICALPLGDLPWPTKQQSNTTSLALLLRNG